MSNRARVEEPARLVAPLVSTGWVAAHGDMPDVVVLEVDEEAGAYYTGHVPGSRKLDWLDDLRHPTRRTFLTPEGFEALMDRLGIGEDTHVVLYGDADNCFAASAYWVFRYYGHERVSLMDGGRHAWLLEQRPVSEEVPEPGSGRGYRVRGTDPRIRATRDQMLAEFVGAPDGTVVLDCRSSQEYAGRVVEMVDMPLERDRVLGHVPGARNLTSTELVDPDTGRLLPLPELRALYAERGVRDGVRVAVYCRVAERSALLWFTLHDLLGHPDVRNYDGGWAEYGALMDVPVERDPDQLSA